MSKFITTMRTPAYVFNSATGFHQVAAWINAGTELSFNTTITEATGERRQMGVLSNGQRVYIDYLAPVLEEVEVKSARLWDWLIGLGIASAVAYMYTKRKKKKE